MKKCLLLVVLAVFTYMSNFLYAQKITKGFPEDLSAKKIIFLEYEQIPISSATNGLIKSMYKTRNERAKTANEMLHAEAGKYPFAYTISRRSQYKELTDKGYDYVLENSLMKSYNDGVNNYAGMHTTYVSRMYIEDLHTGDKYLLFKIDQYAAYNYKRIMKKLSRKARRHFHVAK